MSTDDHVVMSEDDGKRPEDAVSTPVIDEEALDEEISESFPASDPPSDWAGPDLGAPVSRQINER
jgi:hypothetical protein